MPSLPALEAFLQRPWLVRPLGNNDYELIVPRFINLRAGWPLRHVGEYNVFLVSRFIHFLQPLPEWLAAELQFGSPTFRAVIEGLNLTVTEGDPVAVAAKLGKAAIVRRCEWGLPSFALRDYQEAAYQYFLETSAVSIFAPPQTGKTFVALEALATIPGPKLVLAPRRALVEQWRTRIALYLTPHAARDVVVSTYQGAKRWLDQTWQLVVFDEAHHIPANFAIESATGLKTLARMGLSATPVREDGNADLLPALCGWPVGVDWPLQPQQKPRVTVWIVADTTQKHAHALHLAQQPRPGRTLIFVQWLDTGKMLSQRLHSPFISGATQDVTSTLQSDAPLIVASSVLDEGISLDQIETIIEVDFLFGSRMQAGQRIGRLFYRPNATHPGAYHVLMTRDEFQRYQKRLLIYETWGLDIDVRVVETEKLQRGTRMRRQVVQ